MSTEQEKQRLTSEEQQFVERLATQYAPPPLNATQRAAFDHALTERLTQRSQPFFFRPAMLVATACALALLWVSTGLYKPQDEPQQLTTAAPTSVSPTEPTTLLTYAYYNADLYDEESGEGTEDFLPDEYESLADVLIPVEG